MKAVQVTYFTRRRTPAELEQVRVELDRLDTPDDSLARRLIAKSRASEVAEEFRAARRSRQ